MTSLVPGYIYIYIYIYILVSSFDTEVYFLYIYIYIYIYIYRHRSLLSIYIYIYIYRSGFHTRCGVFRRSIPRSHYSPSPPMKLMTSQSLPQSSASSVMIMSHHIDLACLGHRKNYLTSHCFLTENSSQSDKISSPYPPGFHTKQESHPPMDRSGPWPSADT